MENTIKERKFFTARNIALYAILLALIIVLQLWGSSIKIGVTSISLVLIPIVLSGIMLGITGGLITGFAFGVMVIILNGLLMPDGFTNIILAENPIITVLTCLVKGIMAGVVPAIAYKLVKEKHPYLGTVLSSVLSPICNTGFFIVGMLCMSGTINGNFVSEGSNIIYFLFIACAGVNFLIELAVNVILTPSIYRVVSALKKGRNR